MYQEITAPTAQNGNGFATSANDTQPSSSMASAVQVAAVQSGNATKYWLELKAYPAGSARSLWLFVNNGWKRLDNPNQVTSDCIQRAFMGSGSNVKVWYDGNLIKGLVVEGN